MKLRRTTLWIAALVLVIGASAFVATSRAGYETARYEVEKKHGAVEIRRYEAHVVVSTPMKDGGNNGSFGRLFKYISGGNEASAKIEMTTPVFMPAAGDGEPSEMQFVVPAEVAASGAPKPSDPSVKLAKMAGGRYAALRYSGVASAKDRSEKLEKLRAALAELGLEADGPAIHAGYDPPWTPGPMRRNEVLLRLK
jgi:hypothetical protein